MSKSVRFDAVKIDLKKRSPDGYLVSEDSPIARVGVQTYTNPDGTQRREFRPPEEVGKMQSLKTFELLPLTFEHPPQMLNAETVTKYQVGVTGETARFDGKYIRAKIKVLDGKAIDKILDDKIDYLSVGYVCETDDTPGIYNGEKYDSIQKDIVANHVAITKRPRGGKELQLRFDSETSNSNVAYSVLDLDLNEDFTMKQMSLFEDDEWEDEDRLDMNDLESMTKDQLISKIEKLMEAKDELSQERTDAYEMIGSLQGELAGRSDRVDSERYATEQYRVNDLQARNDALAEAKDNLEIELERQKRAIAAKDSEIDILKQQKESEIKARCDSYLGAVMDCFVPVGNGDGNDVWKFLGPSGYLQSPDTTMTPAAIKRLAIQTSARKDSEIVKRLDSMSDAEVGGAFAIWKTEYTPESYSNKFRNSVFAARQDSKTSEPGGGDLRQQYLQQEQNRWKNYKK